MYDCNAFCLGPGCENWTACEKWHGENTASRQPQPEN